MSKTTLDRLVLAGLVVLSVLLYVSTDAYPGIAQKTSAKYVRFLAVSMGGLCAFQLVYSLMKEVPSGTFHLSEHLPRFLGLIAGLILFAIAFNLLGFFIPAAVFIPAIAFMMGQRNPVLLGATTVGTLLFVYVIFVWLLGINLPGSQFV